MAIKRPGTLAHTPPCVVVLLAYLGREPEDIARTYLRVIERNLDAVRAALED